MIGREVNGVLEVAGPRVVVNVRVVAAAVIRGVVGVRGTDIDLTESIDGLGIGCIGSVVLELAVSLC